MSRLRRFGYALYLALGVANLLVPVVDLLAGREVAWSQGLTGAGLLGVPLLNRRDRRRRERE